MVRVECNLILLTICGAAVDNKSHTKPMISGSAATKKLFFFEEGKKIQRFLYFIFDKENLEILAKKEIHFFTDRGGLNCSKNDRISSKFACKAAK